MADFTGAFSTVTSSSSSVFSPSTYTAELSSAVSSASSAANSSERLFLTRPRSTLATTTGGNRGYRGYIQLIAPNGVNVSDTSTYSQYITGTGNVLDQAVNGSGAYGGYASFLVTNISVRMSEKLQVTETFGDGEVYYYFGREPMQIDVRGLLIDSVDNDWFTQWLFMYGQVLRGSMTAQRYQLVKIVMPNMTLVGTISGTNIEQDSARDVDIPFSFTFMAKQVIPNPITASGTALSSNAQYLNLGSTSSQNFLSQAGINAAQSSVLTYANTVVSASSSIGQIGSALSGIGSAISSGLDAASSGLNTLATDINYGTAAAFYSVTATLTGLRAALFSPIYGVLSSLTKLIGAVAEVAGSALSAFSAAASVINNIVGDIESTSIIAQGLVNLVNSEAMIGDAAGFGVSNAYVVGTISSLLDGVGSISTAPPTLFQYAQLYVSNGTIPVTAAFLQDPTIPSLSSSDVSTSKLALLNSGVAYSAATGASL